MWGARGDRPMSDDDLADIWARSLADLAEMHIEPHQRAWLQLTRPLGLVGNTALIAAPNDFVKDQLETRLRALITNALSRELGRGIQLGVTVDAAATADLAQHGRHSAVRGHADEDTTGPMPAIQTSRLASDTSHLGQPALGEPTLGQPPASSGPRHDSGPFAADTSP